jgi:hypothetical protein
VREVPLLAEALFGDRAYHRKVVRRLLAVAGGFEAGHAAGELEAALAAWDRRTVARFRAALG